MKNVTNDIGEQQACTIEVSPSMPQRFHMGHYCITHLQWCAFSANIQIMFDISIRHYNAPVGYLKGTGF